MIRRCDARDFSLIFTIINDGARAYKGNIPADLWTEPYMSRRQLEREIDENGRLKPPWCSWMKNGGSSAVKYSLFSFRAIFHAH